MCNKLSGPLSFETPTTDPLFELEGIKNQWLREAKALPANKYQTVQRQINATAKKIENLFSCMKLTGANPAEMQLKAKEQLSKFNNTCEYLIQNQNNFQNSKDSLRNSLSQFDDKINSPSPNYSPLRLDQKNQTPAKEKMQKDDLWTYHYGNKEELKTCLATHSLLKSEYYKEKGITKAVAEIGAEKFEYRKTMGAEVLNKAQEIVEDLQGLRAGKCLKNGNDELDKVRKNQVVMTTEIALKDCSNLKLDTLKTFHYPDKETLQKCLSNHPLLKTEDNEKNGITKTVAELGSENFANREKSGVGVLFGAMTILEDLNLLPAETCFDSEDVIKESKNLAKMKVRRATEKALIDCSSEGKVSESP